MFDTLLETRAVRPRNLASQAVSVALHAGIIAAIVAASRGVVDARETPVHEEIVFVRPSEPAPPAVQPPVVQPPPAVAAPPLAPGFQVLVAPVSIPDVLPQIDLARAVTNAADFVARGVPGGVADGVVGGVVRAVGDTATYEAYEVDKPAVLLAGSPTPDYPEVLKAAGFPGDVRAVFVVGTDGRAELATLRVARSSHTLFTDAVRKALPLMRFLPAEVRGVKVRQLVEMPFEFRIQ